MRRVRRPKRTFSNVLAPLAAAVLWLAAAAVTAQGDALQAARELRYQQPEAAIERLDRAIESLPAEGNRARLAEFVELRAQIARDLGRLDEAATNVERLLDLARALDDAVLEGRALHLKGTVEAESGDIAAALETFHGARETLEGTDAPAELARVLLAIGVAHSFSGDYERSRRYNQRALPLARRAGDKPLQARVLGNMAVDASELDDAETSLTLHRRSLALSREIGDDRGVAYQLANICDRLVELDRTNEAETTCGEAVDQLERQGHARVLAGVRMTLGDLRRAQNRPGEALTHYNEALEEAAGEVPTVEREVLGKLADLHEAHGRYRQALDYQKRLAELRREAADRERQRQVEEMEARYKVDQREREIELLELESRLQAAQLERRNWILAGTIAALLLAGLAVLITWRGYRTKARLEARLQARNRELERALDTIGELAREDSLTKLYNRRAFLDMAGHELARARRDGRPLTVVMADIDRFKPVNDEHGHATGDEVLREVANRLHCSLREQDVLCRWGGEEFVFLLPGTDTNAARGTADRARQAVAESPVTTDAGDFNVTLTLGIAPLTDDLDDAVNAADQAMYQGKRAGGDRVVVHDAT